MSNTAEVKVGKEVVVTTISITKEMEKGKWASLCKTVTEKPKTKGNFWNGKDTVWIAVEVDLQATYKGQSDAERYAFWVDGYKRKAINAPTRLETLAAVGLSAPSKKAEEEKTLIARLVNMKMTAENIAMAIQKPVDYVKAIMADLR